ncbi:MAG TPA: sulfatase-like hydrolase/transferase [Terriglobia bacterium]|nr:sulfatase-like hydrolase/transferase [Terriglobia bacterium]
MAVLSPLLALAGNPSPAANGEAPSIILISIDTLRADRLSCYGYRRLATPHIDAITQGGTLFTSIDSQVPLTFPSHVSLFTSTYPFFNGIEDNGEALRPNAVTLATLLKSHGYHTGAVVGGFVLDRRFGLDQGFDEYDSTFNPHRERESDPGDVKRSGADVVAAATQWLQATSNRPFFLFLHLYDLHTPYNLPATYRARYGTGYDAELRYVDEQVGVFWDALRQRNLLDKALVVFTSDHGESLGDHGEQTHGYFIYQSALWVPLIIHWPGGSAGFPARAGDPASLMDVAPTILQFAGIPLPREFQGRSLLEMSRPGSTGITRDIYSESLYAHNHFGCASLRALRTGRYKYIQAPKPELYDLAADPGETRNLYEQKRSLALAFQERLFALRARFRSEHPLGGKALDPDALARLNSLGYVAVSSPHSEAADTGADPKDRIAEFEDYGRAIILASTGHIDESNTLLERLLAQHPELLDLRMSLGLNDQRLRRQDDAAREFRQILKTDPLNVQAHFDLGLSLYQLHETDDATKELQAALAIAPYYTRAEELLGSIALQKGDYGRAREQFGHILTIDPNDYAAHYNLGALATLQGQWEEGEHHLQAALLADPADPDAHNTLGSLYLRKGDLDKALTEFQEAIRLRPKYASAHYNLGLVFRKQNRENEAVNEFRRALAIDPQFRPAREALGGLANSPN